MLKGSSLKLGLKRTIKKYMRKNNLLESGVTPAILNKGRDKSTKKFYMNENTKKLEC